MSDLDWTTRRAPSLLARICSFHSSPSAAWLGVTLPLRRPVPAWMVASRCSVHSPLLALHASSSGKPTKDLGQFLPSTELISAALLLPPPLGQTDPCLPFTAAVPPQLSPSLAPRSLPFPGPTPPTTHPSHSHITSRPSAPSAPSSPSSGVACARPRPGPLEPLPGDAHTLHQAGLFPGIHMPLGGRPSSTKMRVALLLCCPACLSRLPCCPSCTSNSSRPSLRAWTASSAPALQLFCRLPLVDRPVVCSATASSPCR